MTGGRYPGVRGGCRELRFGGKRECLGLSSVSHHLGECHLRPELLPVLGASRVDLRLPCWGGRKHIALPGLG